MSLNKHKEAWAAGPGEAKRQGWTHGVGEASWGPGWRGLGGLGPCPGPEGGLRWVEPSLTILGKELVMGREREELGLASIRSSSCPLPVLSGPGRGCGGKVGRKER